MSSAWEDCAISIWDNFACRLNWIYVFFLFSITCFFSDTLLFLRSGIDWQSGWGGRVIWGPCSATSLPRAGLVRPGYAQMCPVGFEYLQGWRGHSLSQQPVPVFNHHNKKKGGGETGTGRKRFSLCLNRISCVSIHAHWLLSFHCILLSSVIFTPSRRYLLHIDKMLTQTSRLKAKIGQLLACLNFAALKCFV